MNIRNGVTFLSSLSLMALFASCNFCDWFGGCPSKQAAAPAAAPKFVIVNVLDKTLFDDCHIKGSINVPYEELEAFAQKNWDKDNTEIVIHCSNYKCTASGAGAKSLSQLGFKHVWAYEAGTAEAKQAGIVDGPCTEKYLEDYARPAEFPELEGIALISTEELKKKIEEFALNK